MYFIEEKEDHEAKSFKKNRFKEKKNYRYRLTEDQITLICHVFNVWDSDEDGKCWSELHPTEGRNYARNDIPNLLRSLGEVLMENELDEYVGLFDPTYLGQFDLSAFLRGMATYYRDKQTEEGWMKVPGKKGKLKLCWRSDSLHEQNQYIRDNFFTQFQSNIMQTSDIDRAFLEKGDKFTTEELELLWSLRVQVGANKGQVCFPRKDDGTIDLGKMYETFIEGINTAIENTTPMNETPLTQFSSPLARSVKGFNGETFHLKD